MVINVEQVYLEPTFCPVIVPANVVRVAKVRFRNTGGNWRRRPSSGYVANGLGTFAFQQKLPTLSFGGSTMPISNTGIQNITNIPTNAGRFPFFTLVLLNGNSSSSKNAFDYLKNNERIPHSFFDAGPLFTDLSTKFVDDDLYYDNYIADSGVAGHPDYTYFIKSDIVDYMNSRIGDPIYQPIYRCFTVCNINPSERLKQASMYTIANDHFDIQMWREGSVQRTISRGYDAPTGSSFRTYDHPYTNRLILGDLAPNVPYTIPWLVQAEPKPSTTSKYPGSEYYKNQALSGKNLYYPPYSGVRVWFRISRKSTVSQAQAEAAYPNGVSKNILDVRVRGTTSFTTS